MTLQSTEMIKCRRIDNHGQGKILGSVIYLSEAEAKKMADEEKVVIVNEEAVKELKEKVEAEQAAEEKKEEQPEPEVKEEEAKESVDNG